MARHTRSANSRAQKKPGRSTLPSTHNTTFSPASSMFSVTTTSASSPSSEPCSVTATPRVRSQCSAISTQAGRRFHGQEAVAELVALQDYYRTWLNALPQNLEPSATAEALRAICDLDLSDLESVEPPRGLGATDARSGCRLPGSSTSRAR